MLENRNIKDPAWVEWIGNVQKCIHKVGRDCEAHFLKTLSKPNAAGGQIDTVSQNRC